MGPRDAAEALAEGSPASGRILRIRLRRRAYPNIGFALLGPSGVVGEEIELSVGVLRSLEAPELNPEATCGTRTG